MQESPIFSKTYDFLLWLSGHTEKFPKSERFRLAKRLDDTAFAFYERIIEASCLQDKAEKLREADITLAKLKFYLRMSYDRKLIGVSQYEHASRLLSEVGRLLGGWIKKVI